MTPWHAWPTSRSLMTFLQAQGMRLWFQNVQRQTAVQVRCSSSESSKTVDVDEEDRMCLIGINRPGSRNAVDPETAGQLREAFGRFEADPRLNVAILYGKGGTFCAGYDLKKLSMADPATVTSSVNLGPMGPTAMQFSKPVIGALSGHAVAGGLELALMCDLRVAEESTVMGVFNRRFGIPLIDGCTARLPKIIGLSRALDLILTGRPVKADEALSMGLVNRVVPDGQGLKEAKKLARLILSFPEQQAVMTDRNSTIRNAFESESFADAFRYEFESGIQVLSKESVSGARRFAEGKGRKGTFDDFHSKL